MNSKKSTPFNRQVESTRPFKPVVAQVKTVPSARSVKSPVAPPVYKPQAKSVAAQMKKAGPLPAKSPPVAPVAYRPQSTPRVLQRKTISQPVAPPKKILPVSPPVYRPQPSPKVLQTKQVGPQTSPNIRSTGASNTIQRALDPTTVMVGGALLVGAIGLVYSAVKCAGRDNQPEAPEGPAEVKEIPLTRDEVVRRAEALKVRASRFKDIKDEIKDFLLKIDKYPSYERANKRLNDIGKKLSGRERSSMGSGSPYAYASSDAGPKKPKRGKAAQKPAEEKKESKVPAQDINPVLNTAKACVLYALVRLKGGAFGVSSVQDLHDLFWSHDRYVAYRQYSDISVIRAIFNDQRSGMTVVDYPPGTTIGALPEFLGAGRYAVITASSVRVSDDDEEHMMTLENGVWWEFRNYFRPNARHDDNALVLGVWR